MSPGPQEALNTTHNTLIAPALPHRVTKLILLGFQLLCISFFRLYACQKRKKNEMACTVLHISLRLCCSVHFLWTALQLQVMKSIHRGPCSRRRPKLSHYPSMSVCTLVFDAVCVVSSYIVTLKELIVV